MFSESNYAYTKAQGIKKDTASIIIIGCEHSRRGLRYDDSNLCHGEGCYI